MTQIRIDTDQVRETGRRLNTEADRLAQIGRELQSAIGSLDTGAWDGRSRARAAPLLNRVRPESEQTAERLGELGRKLARVAEVFEHEDNTAAGNMAGMSWVDFEATHKLASVPWASISLSGLPATGGDTSSLADLYSHLSIKEKQACLNELNNEIEELQQRINNFVPTSVWSPVILAILKFILQRKIALRDALEEAIANDPTPLKYDGPGSNVWDKDKPKKNACVLYAEQRTGVDIDTGPSSNYAKDIPNQYEHTVTLDGGEKDLRDHIEPGMAMVWQPPDAHPVPANWPEGRSPLYGTNAGSKPFEPPPEGDYYDDVSYADHDKGHVAVVEEVGRDYIVVSDQHGNRHRIEQHGRYSHNGPKDDKNFLVGPTFVDLSSHK